jgi:hypothetical protein
MEALSRPESAPLTSLKPRGIRDPRRPRVVTLRAGLMILLAPMPICGYKLGELRLRLYAEPEGRIGTSPR